MNTGPITFGSLCSGIEAASSAWLPLGWRCLWLAEVDKPASAVLAHHYPETPNLGDITAPDFGARALAIGRPDVLIAGTPCQAYSVAGRREGLNDERGNLTLRFIEICDEINSEIILWENVPGVLSDNTNAFGCLLSGLAGGDRPLDNAGASWPSAGVVRGPARRMVWRVLNAQYFGVPQRRNRVFLVASLGTAGLDPAEILFERQSVRGDSETGREAGKIVAALTARGVGTCGADDNQAQSGNLIAMRESGPGFWMKDDIAGTLRSAQGGITSQMIQQSIASTGDVSHCLNAGGMGRQDFETETLICVHGSQDPIVSSDTAHAIGRNNGLESCISFQPGNLARGAGAQPSEEVFATLRGDHRANGDQQPCVAIPINTQLGLRGADTSNTSREGIGIGNDGDPMFTLQAAHSHAVATSAVRRLTVEECEKLQGFLPGHTQAPYRGKPMADGPRYRMVGNSMAVPVIRWIGKRIQRAIERKRK